jgi:hypothetical protein
MGKSLAASGKVSTSHCGHFLQDLLDDGLVDEFVAPGITAYPVDV